MKLQNLSKNLHPLLESRYHAVMVNSGSSANLAMIAALMFRKQRWHKAG